MVFIHLKNELIYIFSFLSVPSNCQFVKSTFFCVDYSEPFRRVLVSTPAPAFLHFYNPAGFRPHPVFICRTYPLPDVTPFPFMRKKPPDGLHTVGSQTMSVCSQIAFENVFSPPSQRELKSFFHPIRVTRYGFCGTRFTFFCKNIFSFTVLFCIFSA